ncbi:hypothetical protein HYU18_03540 [Candidatus Woesearchaeota archaeon]|nr:hypothetical protein [Candidatus Woesearchaeota archaeon]
MASPAKILITAAIIAVVLTVISSLAFAASGPSAPKTVKAEKQNPLPGKVSEEEALKFKCSSLETMRERIKCRLQLDEENEYNYLPEECRALVNESRTLCVDNYKKSQKCWEREQDGDRFECAKSSFGLTGTVAAQKSQCENLAGENKSSCLLELRDRVDAVVKFRIYNLEDKAQRLMERGLATEEDVLNFVAAVEQQKQNYNDAKTIDEKKSVVKGVQKLWQDFIAKVKGK